MTDDQINRERLRAALAHHDLHTAGRHDGRQPDLGGHLCALCYCAPWIVSGIRALFADVDTAPTMNDGSQRA